MTSLGVSNQLDYKL